MNRPMLGVVLATGLLAAPAAAEPLRVCLDERNPPFSSQRGASGFDVAVSEAVAGKLGRSFAPQWYENERDDNRSGPQDVGAMLAAGLCDLAAGFPLTVGALAPPAALTARLPGHAGGPPPRRLPRVALGALAASRPYYRLRLAVVLGPGAGDRTVRSLADLAGLRLGAPGGTLAGALLLTWRGGALAPDLTTLDSRADPLAELEAGRLDATMVEAAQFDAHRAAHPGSALRDSGWRHPFGFNLGFAAAAGRHDLLDQVDAALDGLLASGALAALAVEAGLQWSAPEPPDVAARLTPAQFRGEQDAP